MRNYTGVAKFCEEGRRNLDLELVEAEDVFLLILLMLAIINFLALGRLILDIYGSLLEEVSQSVLLLIFSR